MFTFLWSENRKQKWGDEQFAYARSDCFDSETEKHTYLCLFRFVRIRVCTSHWARVWLNKQMQIHCAMCNTHQENCSRKSNNNNHCRCKMENGLFRTNKRWFDLQTLQWIRWLSIEILFDIRLWQFRIVSLDLELNQHKQFQLQFDQTRNRNQMNIEHHSFKESEQKLWCSLEWHFPNTE